ncbi:MAG: long-chain fatty acid--CoA ligase [bacterium]|nr:long-chain fatty acid--CoA ligase [bacterium]
MGSTLNELFLEIVDRRDDATAFLVKRDRAWRSLSYRWAFQEAKKTAFGLKSLGFERGGALAILAENRPEWATTDYGAMAAGHPLVPLYTTLIPSQIAYILNDAEAKVLFVSSMAHLRTVLSIREQITSLKQIVVFYPERLAEDEFIISLNTLKSLGDGHTDDEYRELAARTREDDVATFVYTSGTTGNPKGVVLTHANFVAEFDAVRPAFEGGDDDMSISFLPLSHILQRVADSFSLLRGMTIAYAESLETLGENLREVKPTHIIAVPRVYEKIHSRIYEGVEKGPALKRRLFHWAIGVGKAFRVAEATGSVPIGLAVKHGLADKLVFSKIRAATGGRLKFYVSTGAPLAAELGRFFHCVGIRILEAYGMTELTGAATANLPDNFKFGTVGKPGPGVELKIAEEGEICIKGGIVMREYWKQPDATAETIDNDGWLHTGDVGHVDDAGFLHITDRIKELIVTAGGKNVAPQPLENALKSDKYINQAMIIGDTRNFISAIIVPDGEVLQAWAREHDILGEIETLCTDPTVNEMYQRVVSAKMEGFSRYEQVRKFTLVPEEFNQDRGELTPTLKLKRRVLLARYADVIEGMYGE